MLYQMRYQIGGTLTNHDPTYVMRQADEDLYQSLQRGEFCYVFNTRQMGKSSLLVRTKKRLSGHQCLTLDMTNVGTEMITPQQWYKGILGELVSGLQADQPFEFSMGDLHAWWQDQGDIPLVQKLSRFLSDVLLKQLSNRRLFIMVDEIDSVLALPFAVDDFFALVRYCYNQRALNPVFQRITFALFGVATPADLIQDKTRTPFNIGHAVTLHGFSMAEAAHLADGLAVGERDPKTVLQAILHWTGGQPFLTQRLCQLVCREDNSLSSLTDTEWVGQIVQNRIIDHWESQDEPEHLRTIRDRILRNEPRAGRLLGLQQKLLDGESISTDDSLEQTELLLSGLVIQQQTNLRIKNPIYQAVFNQTWVSTQLSGLRPYSQALQSWSESDQSDSSRLLRGQALQDAQKWATDKSLGDLDYQFLRASEALEREEVQQKFEIAQAKEVKARLTQERRASKLQRYLLGAVSLGMVGAISLSIVAFFQYRRALQNEQQAAQETTRTLATAAQAQVISNQRLDALVSAVKAKQRLNSLRTKKPLTVLNNQVISVLYQSLFQASETNRFIGHTSNVNDVDFSPDGKMLVSASPDHHLRLWQQDGTLIKALKVTEDDIYAADFSPKGELIAVAGGTKTIDLWSVNGEKIRSLTGAHEATVWFVTFGPKGDFLVSASQDGSVGLWSPDGTLIQKITGHESAVYGADISPDQQLIASASTDGTAKLWKQDGQLHANLSGHEGSVWSVAFSPNEDLIVTTGQDQTVRLWRQDGTPVKTLTGHEAAIWGVDFSPDGTFFVSTSVDGTARVWNRDGTLREILRGHDGTIWGVDISPDSQTIATAGWDQTARLWRWQHPLRRTIHGAQDSLTGIALNSTGDQFVAAGLDGTVKLWSYRGKLLKSLGSHDVEVWSVAFSPTDDYVVSGSADNTAKVWSLDGNLLHTLTGHPDAIYSVDISPDGKIIATSSIDGLVQLWNKDGTLRRKLTTEQTSAFNLKFSPNGKYLATVGAQNALRIWDLDGKLVHSVEHETSLNTVEYSADGQTIVTVDDLNIQIRKQNGEIIQTLSFDSAEVASLGDIAFSPTDDIFATALWNSRLRTWQIKLFHIDGTEVTTLIGHQDEIRSLEFSSDGKTLISGGFDETFIVWNLEEIMDLDELAFACGWIADYLQTSPEIDDENRSLCEQ